ncbi:MAG TPA: SIMPL domain-containing protein [Methylomirabilota bacterium]|nr:SIMPL domain-containing protein [Methylomirabilota bacterium]
MSQHRALIVLALALALSACARMGGGSGMGPHQRATTVTVTGTGSVTAAPDMAQISTGVVTQSPTAAGALAANSQAMERLLQALAAQGVAARDVQTTSISVSPLRRQGRDGQPPEITGYEVTNQVRVKVRDLSRLGRVLDQQVGQGANLVYGIQFGQQEPAPLLDEARRRAMADARRRAELYAAAVSLKVGRVVAVQETGAASPRPELGARVAMAAAPVAPGEQEVQASVTVTFTLEP